MKIQKFNPSSTEVNRESLGGKTWVNDKLLYDAQLRVIDHTKKIILSLYSPLCHSNLVYISLYLKNKKYYILNNVGNQIW